MEKSFIALFLYQIIRSYCATVTSECAGSTVDQCYPSQNPSDVYPIRPAGSSTICCVTISPEVTEPGVQPEYIDIAFQSINGTVFTTGCSISIYSVLRLQESFSVQENIKSLADITGTNHTISVPSSQALIYIDGSDTCNWPDIYVAFTWQQSTSTIRSTSLQIFYGLLLIFAFPICCVMLTTCPGSTYAFNKTNLTRPNAKLILFLVGTVFGIIFLLLFALRGI